MLGLNDWMMITTVMIMVVVIFEEARDSRMIDGYEN